MWQGDVSFADSLVISLIGMIVVMLELIILAVLIVILSKAIRALDKKSKGEKPEAIQNAVPLPTVTAVSPASQLNTESDGNLRIENVSDEQAAVIMSVVSAECGLPLDKLSFKSIKKVN